MLGLLHWADRLSEILANREKLAKFPFLELRHFVSPSVSLNEMESPRYMKTHLPVSLAPREIFEKKPKCVFVFRNPRDVCMSYYNFHVQIPKYYQPRDLAQFVDWFTNGPINYGTYWQWTKDWFNYINANQQTCHVIYYEDLVQDFLPTVEKLSQFLGTTITKEELVCVEQATRFENMAKWVSISNRKTPLDETGISKLKTEFDKFDEISKEMLSDVGVVEHFLSKIN